MKSSSLSATNHARLKALKKANRETMHTVKPMVSKDKRREQNRKACRNYRPEF